MVISELTIPVPTIQIGTFRASEPQSNLIAHNPLWRFISDFSKTVFRALTTLTISFSLIFSHFLDSKPRFFSRETNTGTRTAFTFQTWGSIVDRTTSGLKVRKRCSLLLLYIVCLQGANDALFNFPFTFFVTSEWTMLTTKSIWTMLLCLWLLLFEFVLEKFL